MSPAAPTLLIVDDDEEYCKLLARFFHPRGYTPVHAANGHEAMALIKQTPSLNLLIANKTLNGMSARDLLAALAETRQNDVQVILVSGAIHQADAAEAASLGVHAVIPKTAPLSELMAVVKSARDD